MGLAYSSRVGVCILETWGWWRATKAPNSESECIVKEYSCFTCFGLCSGFESLASVHVLRTSFILIMCFLISLTSQTKGKKYDD